MNLIDIKVVSNGVYPGNPGLMESEYHDNRDWVSRTATESLEKVLDYIDGKTIQDLGCCSEAADEEMQKDRSESIGQAADLTTFDVAAGTSRAL